MVMLGQNTDNLGISKKSQTDHGCQPWHGMLAACSVCRYKTLETDQYEQQTDFGSYDPQSWYLDRRASHFPKGSLTPGISSTPRSIPALIQQRSNMAEKVNEDKVDLLAGKGDGKTLWIISAPVPFRKLRVRWNKVLRLAGDLELGFVGKPSKHRGSCFVPRVKHTLTFFPTSTTSSHLVDSPSYVYKYIYLLLLWFLQMLWKKDSPDCWILQLEEEQEPHRPFSQRPQMESLQPALSSPHL